MTLITLLMVLSVGMVLFALLGWKRRKIVPSARLFSAYMVIVALYCGAYAIQLTCASIPCESAATWFECFGITFLPIIWLFLAIHSSGLVSRIPRYYIIFLYLIPILLFTLFFSVTLLHSHTLNQILLTISSCSVPSLIFSSENYNWIPHASLLLAVLLGNVLFLYKLLSSPRHLRLQAAVIFLGSLYPLAALSVHFEGSLATGFNLFPFAFAVSGLHFTYGLFRYRLVNLAPLVRSTLVENMDDGMLVFNHHGRLLDLNRTVSSLLGMEQQMAIGEYREHLLAEYPRLLEVVLAGGGLVDERTHKIQGGRLTAQVIVTPIRGRWWRKAGSLVLIHDISGLQKAESDLRDSEEKFRLLFEAAPDPILLMDDYGRCIDCNSAAVQLFGVASRGNVLHRSLTNFSPEYQPDGELSSDKETGVRRLAFAEGTALSEWAFRHYDGSLVIVDLSIAIISIKGIKVQLIHLRDITEKKHVEQKLREISLTDELTGLHNRRGFMTLALQQIKIADRLAQGMTLLYADLDDLKGINDTYGHLAGDQALTDAAAVLKASLRASDILARLGGDEFVGLILESGGETEMAVKARVQENLNAHNLLRIRPYKLSFSIGTARYEVTSPCSVEELLEIADREMYCNKLGKKSGQDR